MLEGGHSPEVQTVESLYRAHCPASERREFTEVLEHLSESFIQVEPELFGDKLELWWMHPSYRDLVIEELSRDAHLRRLFLTNCGVDGLKLAISEEGGERGEIKLALLTSKWVEVQVGATRSYAIWAVTA